MKVLKSACVAFVKNSHLKKKKKKYSYILNKSQNATLLLLVKMAEKPFIFQFFSNETSCAIHVFRASESQKVKFLCVI